MIYRKNKLIIDGFDVSFLAKKFNTPLYCYSLKKIKAVFSGNFDELDGLSYFDDNFWFNVRGSNTEPKLRVNIEASSQKILDEVLEKISTTI